MYLNDLAVEPRPAVTYIRADTEFAISQRCFLSDQLSLDRLAEAVSSMDRNGNESSP